LNQTVLVLNADYQPLNLCSAKRAIVLWLADKVDILEEYDDLFSAQKCEFKVPSVIRLKYYIRKPNYLIPLSRKNIHIRDNYTCQYCGKHVTKPTVDHVIPQVKGGQTTWENLVTCCFECNNKKGSKTLKESGLVLKKTPKRPHYANWFTCRARVNQATDWDKYLTLN
jgi:5-methylcytosine-specific restriction endonuclease McrA